MPGKVPNRKGCSIPGLLALNEEPNTRGHAELEPLEERIKVADT